MVAPNALEKCRQRRQRQKGKLIWGFILLINGFFSILFWWDFEFTQSRPAVLAVGELNDLCQVEAKEGDTFSLYLAASTNRRGLNQPVLEPEFCRLNGLRSAHSIYGAAVYLLPRGMEVDKNRLEELRIARSPGRLYNK